MSNFSILFPESNNSQPDDSIPAPECLADLNLDQVIDSITSPKTEYNLKPFYYFSLFDLGTIIYRQEICCDLETSDLLPHLKSFAKLMALVRRYFGMIEKQRYQYHQEGWFLEAALIYHNAVKELTEKINNTNITSEGFLNFRNFLNHYIKTVEFVSLVSDSNDVKNKLVSAKYNIIIKGGWVRVRKFENEIDYLTEVLNTFEKFRSGEGRNYLKDLSDTTGMNHVEAQILGCVAKLYPEIFKELDLFFTKHNKFFNDTIRRFDREIQFYIAYLDFIGNIKEKGLSFSYPKISIEKDDIHANNAFDIALANSFLYDSKPVIVNDFHLSNPERIIIVSGPNQGGKTTFSRMFGQLHYLASLGLPIPGVNNRMYLFDKIFTHFEKEEDIRNLRGKLHDDLLRIRTILDRATEKSIIIMNEIFTSTSLDDAIFLSKEVIEKILDLDAFGVCVSFIDELSRMSEKTVSMVSTVIPEDPSQRTFKIIRKPADGLSYAISVAEKHNLTYEKILERIKE